MKFPEDTAEDEASFRLMPGRSSEHHYENSQSLQKATRAEFIPFRFLCFILPPPSGWKSIVGNEDQNTCSEPANQTGETDGLTRGGRTQSVRLFFVKETIDQLCHDVRVRLVPSRPPDSWR